MTRSILSISIDVARHPTDRPERERLVPASPTEVVAVLSDADSRTILSSVAAESRTVSELAATCEIPLSTAYRKVDTLVETGLLDERMQLRTTGTDKHTHEYRLRPTSVELVLTASGELEATCARETQRTSAEPRSSQDDTTRPRTIETNDNKESSASTTQYEPRPPPSPFVDVPGTEKVIRTQTSPVSSQHIDNTTPELSKYLQGGLMHQSHRYNR